MNLRIPILLYACITLFTLAARDSLACGALVFNEESAGSIVDQEIVIATGVDRTIVVTSVGYADAQSEFAFLLPVQKAPLAVYDGDPKLFSALQDLSVPRVLILKDSSAAGSSPGCCGMLGGAKSGAAAPGGGAEVEVVSRGETNSYEYVVVGGKSGETLAAWLDKEHFAPPEGLQTALDGYIRNKWLFLAARLKPKALRGSLAPIEIQMPKIPIAELKYPLGLSAQSVPPTKSVDVLVYLLSVEPMLPGNYALDQVKSSELRSLSERETNYKEVSNQKLSKEGFLLEFGRGDFHADELFATWARPEKPAAEGEPPKPLNKSYDTLFPQPFSITRLHARLGGKALRDVTFKSVEPSELVKERELLVRYDSKVGASAIGLLVAVAMLRRGTRKRRHSMPKRALFSAKN